MTREKKIAKTPLTHEEFVQRIKELNLNKKEFADMVGLGHQTVINWSSKPPIPYWVTSWLEYYSDSIQLKALQKIMQGK
ncbi:MAG: hypothetical protein LBD41_06970 [Clostridiales Family XIII bacterium]|jgi:DNA-binding XRE family transcriptional regulator|nr:hypothetical protein [Clostridiales Family XIII bacterium]